MLDFWMEVVDFSGYTSARRQRDPPGPTPYPGQLDEFGPGSGGRGVKRTSVMGSRQRYTRESGVRKKSSGQGR